MSLSTAAILLGVGIALLIVGADLLLRGAASLAKRFSVPEIVIGLTVVAFGTSAPELAVSVVSSVQGRSDMIFGNVIGSNAFNTLMVLGAAGLIRPLVVQKNTVWKEIPFLLVATAVLLFVANDPWWRGSAAGGVSRVESLAMLGLFALFLIYVFGISKVKAAEPEVKVYSLRFSLLLLAVGLGGLFFGGKFTVDSAVAIARAADVSEKFIATVIVAVGTSLPELATSAVAAYKGRFGMAVGNSVGSSLFNFLLVLPVAGLIRPVAYNAAFNVDMMVLLGGTVLLFATMFTGRRRRLDRWEAALMIAAYGGYLAYLVYLR